MGRRLRRALAIPSSPAAPDRGQRRHLIRSFTGTLTTFDGNRLPEWIADAMRAGLPATGTFAAGRRATSTRSASD
ncbi:hypothetical protein [Streptomyces sp. URMC 129]|uniref:hypothetical protein n=1 Tax=Streptomyces sp. URMC 129 TaxID=3423407 RepID=UPI003F1A5F33